MEKIKAIVYGVGEMGKIMTKLLVEKGVDIVGAVGHVSNIGKDLGEVAGLGYPLNVTISDNADAVLSGQKADIALVALFTEMERMYPHLKKCVENGLNTITLSEEALYPWTISPELTSKLDMSAKKHGVTITGSGWQDSFMVNLISLLTGVSHTIESVAGKVRFNVADYGPVVAEYYHIGQSKEDFYHWLREEGNRSRTALEFLEFRVALEALIADLGLTAISIQEFVEPTTGDIDLEYKPLGKIVRKGEITGLTQIVEIETKQGINFRGEMIGKIYQRHEEDINEWHIKGFPELRLKNNKVPSKIATCTQMVNRIPDVINSEPGFITVEKLPKLKYRAYPLHFYLHKR